LAPRARPRALALGRNRGRQPGDGELNFSRLPPINLSRMPAYVALLNCNIRNLRWLTCEYFGKIPLRVSCEAGTRITIKP
jgi:hypothetical protein